MMTRIRQDEWRAIFNILDDRPVTLTELEAATGIDMRDLEPELVELADAGWLDTSRGRWELGFKAQLFADTAGVDEVIEVAGVAE